IGRSELDGWLRRAARDAKVELREREDVSVTIAHPSVEFPITRLSRQDVNEVMRPLLDEALGSVWLACRSALMSQVAGRRHRGASMSPHDARKLSEQALAEQIDHVLIAGGMAHVPAIYERLAATSGPDRVHVDPIDP